MKHLLGVHMKVIQVGHGGESKHTGYYEENRWREAILAYLFGVWKNDDQLMSRPKLVLDGVGMRLYDGWYEFYGLSEEMPNPQLDPLKALTVTSNDQQDFEYALIRFVKNDQFRSLIIRPYGMGKPETIVIWKKERRGEFGIRSEHLPEGDPVLKRAHELGARRAELEKELSELDVEFRELGAR